MHEKKGYSNSNMRCKLHALGSYFSGDVFGNPHLGIFVDPTSSAYVSVGVMV